MNGTIDPGVYMLVLIISMSISMVLISILINLAPRLGMMDVPGERTVHANVIPRVGGIGIIVGLLAPLILLLEFDNFVISFISGCVILLLFGAVDDAKDLKPSIKLAGQMAAAIIIVYAGDVYVYHLPFFGVEDQPEYIVKPFTVFAIVGVINALNLSDGLDGLAGGEALLSFMAIAYMAYQYEGFVAIMIAAATIGGVFGFLRFNSHPARVFMGDSGSQTLGFVLAVLVVYLSNNVNSALSPMIPALLIGIPIIDSLVVFYMRARRGANLMVGAKDHLHHRLLSLGFYHYESVVVIYSIHLLFVICAILLPYETDWVLMAIYSSVLFTVFGIVYMAERKGMSVPRKGGGSRPIFRDAERLSSVIITVLSILLVSSMLVASTMTTTIPVDFSVASAILFVLLAVGTLGRIGDSLKRLIMYTVLGFSVYLLLNFPDTYIIEYGEYAYAYYLIMVSLLFFSVRLSSSSSFEISTLDYLVVITTVIIGLLPDKEIGGSNLTLMIIQIIILFYVCEFIIQQSGRMGRTILVLATMASLMIFAVRGFV